MPQGGRPPRCCAPSVRCAPCGPCSSPVLISPEPPTNTDLQSRVGGGCASGVLRLLPSLTEGIVAPLGISACRDEGPGGGRPTALRSAVGGGGSEPHVLARPACPAVSHVPLRPHGLPGTGPYVRPCGTAAVLEQGAYALCLLLAGCRTTQAVRWQQSARQAVSPNLGPQYSAWLDQHSSAEALQSIKAAIEASPAAERDDPDGVVALMLQLCAVSR